MKIRINKYVALFLISIPGLFIVRLMHVPIEYYVLAFFIALVVLMARNYRIDKMETKNGKK